LTGIVFVKNYWWIHVLLRYCEDICPVPEIVEERVRQKKKEKQGNYTNPRPERAFSETELENYLPDGESRKLWLDLTHGTKKSVDISHLIQSLGSEFNRNQRFFFSI
jgi:hypothetical protein